MGIVRWTAAVFCAGLLASAAATGQREPIGGAPLFSDTGTTRAKVQRMLGAPPARCTSASPERWICTWRVAPGERGHALLAAGQGVDRPLQLVCAFDRPLATGRGHCTAHRSIPLRAVASLADDGESASRLSREEIARRALERARDLEALSRLLGGGPDDCVQWDDAHQVCHWVAGGDDPGHATLGPLTATRGRARLTCLLPLDGGERGEDSCRVSAAR